jgi:hypothetical protein
MLRSRRPTCEQTIRRHVVAPHPQEILHHYLFLHFSLLITHLSHNLSCSVLSLLLHMDGVAQHSLLLAAREPCPGSCSCTDACCASVAQCGEPWAGVAPRACVSLLAMERLCWVAMDAGPRWRHGLSLLAARCGSSLAAVTTPPEVIPYYRLNHSIWSLSDNKESSRWVLPGLHPVNHLGTQRGSNVCIKLPRRRVQSALQINTNFPRRVHYYKHSSWYKSKWFRVLLKQRKY